MNTSQVGTDKRASMYSSGIEFTEVQPSRPLYFGDVPNTLERRPSVPFFVPDEDEGKRPQVMTPPPQTPPRPKNPVLADGFVTPPRRNPTSAFSSPSTTSPRSVPMERTPPNRDWHRRSLCGDCASRAREFYHRAHADHLATDRVGREVVVDWPKEPLAPMATMRDEDLARTVHPRSRGSLDFHVENVVHRTPPQDSRDMWPDPYDGAM